MLKKDYIQWAKQLGIKGYSKMNKLELEYECLKVEAAAAAIHIEELEAESIRKCTNCNSIMNEGYYDEANHNYMCSDECRDQLYTPEEIAKLQEDEENLILYWTEWE